MGQPDSAWQHWFESITELLLSNRIELKSGKQVFEEQRQVMEGLIKRRFEEGDLDFRDELDHMLDEIEDEQQKMLTNESGPGKDDTIH